MSATTSASDATPPLLSRHGHASFGSMSNNTTTSSSVVDNEGRVAQGRVVEAPVPSSHATAATRAKGACKRRLVVFSHHPRHPPILMSPSEEGNLQRTAQIVSHDRSFSGTWNPFFSFFFSPPLHPNVGAIPLSGSIGKRPALPLAHSSIPLLLLLLLPPPPPRPRPQFVLRSPSSQSSSVWLLHLPCPV